MRVSLISGRSPVPSAERVPILIEPSVRARLHSLLMSPHFMSTGVGYSAFINRACEAAETEIAQAQARPRVRDRCEVCEDDPAGQRWLCPNRANHEPLA